MRDEQDQDDLKGIRRWWAEVRQSWDEQVMTNGLLRHLIHEPSFLVAVVVFTICGLGVAAMVPKLWNPAPPQFSRTVRVSLLDYAQAWNLRRTARNAMAEGRWDEALVAWRTAIANNVAAIESHRGALETLRDAPWVHSGNASLGLFSAELLIELSGTNRVDSMLVANVLDRYRMPEIAMEVMRPWESELTREEEAVWMRSLFSSGRLSQFEARWQEGAGRQADDASLVLHRAAIDAQGPPARSVEGLERLRTALTDPARRLEAARLLCWAATRREDVAEYERGLAVLRELGSTMVQDEAGAWSLMARRDRLEDARKAAREFRGVPPATPMEAAQLVRAWSELGLGELALTMLKEHAERYGLAFDVWASYFDLLLERKEWDEARRVAAGVRGNASVRDEVMSMTWYVEAVADLAEDRRSTARNQLQRLLESALPNPGIVLRYATGLIRAGEFDASLELLKRIEDAMNASPDYWMQVMINGQGRKDVEVMQRATERVLALQPGSLVGLNMRLGLMLLQRQTPSEALALSLRLMSSGPVSSGARINHAAALLQNARTDEAGAMLARLEPARLSPMERAAWQVAQVEYLGQKGRDAEALALGESVEAGLLMPPDEAWLKTYLAESRRRTDVGNR